VLSVAVRHGGGPDERTTVTRRTPTAGTRRAVSPRTSAVGIAALAVAGSLTLAGAAAAQAHPTATPVPLPPAAQRQIATLAAANVAGAARLRAAGVTATDEGGTREAAAGPGEIADRAQAYAFERTAPAATVPAPALPAARRAAAALPRVGGTWDELTAKPYEAAPAGYSDPEWSNEGSGFGLVGGRMTALAVDGPTTYAGAADGGLWRTSDGGTTWTALGTTLPSLSTGALLVGPGHSVWVGTGEANTNADAYSGQGVWASTDRGTTLTKVGGSALDGAEVFRLVDDTVGHVYAATTRGLFRMSSTGRGSWTRVLAPTAADGPYDNQVTDVVVRPGTHGATVLAAVGWRNGSPDNGFYLSRSGGGADSFAKIVPTGTDGPATDTGRVTLAYAADGSALYALVQSPDLLLSGAATNLRGLYEIPGGDPTKPYVKVADSASLGRSGSAISSFPGYHVGIQSWYNQALAVDPTDPKRVYVSLEEVFQSDDGGRTFTTASPYWNYGLACGAACPDTTHPDQHALAVSDGQVWIGNDGGVYRRSTAVHGYGSWVDTNAGLHTTQFYGVGTGKLAAGATAFWGGLQDNGTAVLPGADAPQMIEPAGGDGGQVLVDPRNGQNAVGEYVYAGLYLTRDGGHTFRDIPPPDSATAEAQFIAPLAADPADPDSWIVGGRHVYRSTAGWDTVCDATTCDWTALHDLGEGTSSTAVAVSGDTVYAGWLRGAGPGPSFATGIDTNAGGTWHRVSSPVLPQRYLASLTVDPADADHVYAVYNGFSRRWVDGGGTGHVFESRDGGATWADISGNLPDIGGDDLVIGRGGVVLATDAGVYAARVDRPGSWYRFGSRLPNVSVNDLTIAPDGRTVVAGTHGRGIWTLQAP